jgi:hypothetical protein
MKLQDSIAALFLCGRSFFYVIMPSANTTDPSGPIWRAIVGTKSAGFQLPCHFAFTMFRFSTRLG